MFRNSYQRGMLTVFFSVGSKPLKIWDTHTENGHITRFLDQDIKSMVLEIGGTNVSTTYMTCPKGNQVLGITMPFLVMIVKNLKKYFTFEVTILDETGTRRRFRVSNFQSSTQILPLCTVMPIGLSEGWNQIQFNLAEFTRRAYKKQFVEVQKLKINANIRLRRIYFTERLIPEEQLPPEYKLYFPLASRGAKKIKAFGSDKENIQTGRAQVEAPPAEEQKEEPKPEEVRGSKAENIISKTSIRSVKKAPSKSTVNNEEGVAPPGSKKPSVSSVSAKRISAVAAAGSASAQLVEDAAEQHAESTPGEQVLVDAPAESPEGQAGAPEGPAESTAEAEAEPPVGTTAETPTQEPIEASATPAEGEPPAVEVEPAPAEQS